MSLESLNYCGHENSLVIFNSQILSSFIFNTKLSRSQMDTKTSKRELKRRQNVTSEIGSDELLNGPLTKKSKKRKKKSFHN